MKKSSLLTIFFLSVVFISSAQKTYNDSMQAFIKSYVEKHEVVIGEDKKLMAFYPVNKNYRVVANFERVKNGKWFTMETSANSKQTFRVYGTIRFTLHDTSVQLNIYQSQKLMLVPEYKDNLFLPFTDLTSGEETYASGRYIDLIFDDIIDNKVVIDFNKAYNPYCCYATGYHCPIPPKENALTVAINAGEKKYSKPIH